MGMGDTRKKSIEEVGISLLSLALYNKQPFLGYKKGLQMML